MVKLSICRSHDEPGSCACQPRFTCGFGQGYASKLDDLALKFSLSEKNNHVIAKLDFFSVDVAKVHKRARLDFLGLNGGQRDCADDSDDEPCGCSKGKSGKLKENKKATASIRWTSSAEPLSSGEDSESHPNEPS